MISRKCGRGNKILDRSLFHYWCSDVLNSPPFTSLNNIYYVKIKKMPRAGNCRSFSTWRKNERSIQQEFISPQLRLFLFYIMFIIIYCFDARNSSFFQPTWSIKLTTVASGLLLTTLHENQLMANVPTGRKNDAALFFFLSRPRFHALVTAGRGEAIVLRCVDWDCRWAMSWLCIKNGMG